MFFDSCFCCFSQDSSSVVEWTQTPKEKCSQGVDRPSSYEAEWDMVTTVSFKKKPHSNGGTEKKMWRAFLCVQCFGFLP